MQSAIATVTRIDAYTRQVEQNIDRFYETEYPALQQQWERFDAPGQCDMSYAVPYYSAEGGQCERLAFVSNLNSGQSMCRDCAEFCCPEILEEK